METMPVTLHILWGANSEEDLPSSYELPAADCVAAFLRGVDEADGWMGVTFVRHANFKVNKEGEIVEGKAPAREPATTDRFAVWGDDPEPGTRAVRYPFVTVAEAEAFQLGANEASGWTTYQVVPGAAYRAIPVAQDLRDPEQHTWLTPEGRERLVALLDQDELTDALFATPAGDWADEDGQPQGGREAALLILDASTPEPEVPVVHRRRRRP